MGPEDFTFEEGLREAEEKYGKENLVVLEREYHTPRISHCHIELPVSWAYQEPGGKITVTSSTQIPHIVRRVISQALGLPVGKIRVIKPYIGGGFGNKQDVLYEPLNAYLTTVVGGRPVRLEISREETIYGTRTRHAIDGNAGPWPQRRKMTCQEAGSLCQQRRLCVPRPRNLRQLRQCIQRYLPGPAGG